MIYFRRLRFSNLITNGWLGGGIAILIWLLVSELGVADPLWFAGPVETFNAIYEIFSNSWENVAVTLILVVISTLLASTIGIALGMILGLYGRSYSFFRPTLDFWRSIPPIIVIPIVYRWNPMDDDYFWRVMLVLFGCVPIITAMIADAIISSESANGRASPFLTLNPSKFFLFRYVVGYEILPTVFTGIRTVSSFAVIIVIVSEMVLAPKTGIGAEVIHYQTAYEMNFVYGYAVVAGIIGIFLNKTWRFAERLIVWWDE